MTLKYYQRTVPAAVAPANVAGTVTIDASKGDSFLVPVTAIVSTATITNPMQYQVITLTYVVGGTAFAYVWPTISYSGSNVAPTNVGINKTDSMSLVYDGAAWQELSRSQAGSTSSSSTTSYFAMAKWGTD